MDPLVDISSHNTLLMKDFIVAFKAAARQIFSSKKPKNIV